MRTSNRSKILEAAARVVQREGIRSFTYDAVAEEAGLTKGGLLYHFASREELVEAVHEHLAQEWEDAMIAALGKPDDTATPAERHAAYAKVNATGAKRAELLFIIEGSTSAQYFAQWETVMAKWAPPIPAADASEEDLERFIVRLASDGLWLFEAITHEHLDPALRHAVSERLARKITRNA